MALKSAMNCNELQCVSPENRQIRRNLQGPVDDKRSLRDEKPVLDQRMA
jgi:hypothetical protein